MLHLLVLKFCGGVIKLVANMIQVLLVLLLLLPFFSLLLKHRHKQLPPGPYTWQLIANISQFKKEPHVALAKMAKVYGPLLSVRIGAQMVVVASSPATAMEILKTHDQTFSGRYLPLTYHHIPQAVNSSIILSGECNDTWKFLRRIGHNFIFSPKAVESKATIRKVKVREMLQYLRKKEGEVVNLEDIVNAAIANIMSSILASKNLFANHGEGKSDEKVHAFIDEIVEMVSIPGLGDLVPILKRLDVWSKRKGMDIYLEMKFLWEDIIQERRARDNKAYSTPQDFVDVLIENAFSDDQIYVQLSELLTAGTATTTVTAIWLMVELIRNPDIMLRVRHEIAEAIEGYELNESRLSKCQYFQACIKETLRFHVPGPFLIPRRATETQKVNGCIIPKDTIVVLNTWALAMDDNNWKDAAIFKPDRFLNSNEDYSGSNFQYTPFSSGRRMCPGPNVASKNLQLVVATLVHYFDWKLPNGVDLISVDANDKFGTTLKKEKPLCLITTVRG